MCEEPVQWLDCSPCGKRTDPHKKKLSQQVLIQSRRKFDLPIRNLEEHKDEIYRMHCLLKASRKQQLGCPRASCKPAMSFVDNLETQPMDDELHSGYAQEFAVGLPFAYISVCLQA